MKALESAVSIVVCLFCASGIQSDPARLARIRAAEMPDIKQPVLFHTPQADAILSALEICPPENAFNQVIDDWPLHPNSKNIELRRH